MKISPGYWLGKYEVTQGEWKHIVGTSVREQRDKENTEYPFFGEGDHFPMCFVSWLEAELFCKKLTLREGAAGRLPPGYEYALPTEAQWEYACRAGTTGAYPGDLDRQAWYNQIVFGSQKDVPGGLHSVGTKEPNAWGLYDMLGNVAEWCRDWYTPAYAEDPAGELARGPTAGPSIGRSVRGGDWTSPQRIFLRAGARAVLSPEFRGSSLGFRLALVSTAKVTPGPAPGTPSVPSKEVASVSPSTLTEGQPWTVPNLGLSMNWIAPGEFLMGTPETEPGHQPYEGPQVRVRLSHGYWLGQYEVTQAQWNKIAGSTVNEQRSQAGTAPGRSREGPTLPMNFVSWYDAEAFCQKLTELSRAAGKLPPHYEYALPTEAQWEYACRAGTTTPCPGELAAIACYDESSRGVQPVGSKQPNAWGLYDMIGNLDEWCRDAFTAGYRGDGHGVPVENPVAAIDDAAMRTVRGGNWATTLQAKLRSGARAAFPPAQGNITVGFRLALVKVD